MPAAMFYDEPWRAESCQLPNVPLLLLSTWQLSCLKQRL